MANFETRNPNEARSPNDESRAGNHSHVFPTFVIRHSTLIRISGFGLRVFRRGSAEIELLIVCIILLSLLLLVAGMLTIGGARTRVVQEAAYQAMHDATEAAAPQYDSDNPIIGIADLRAPALPNRVHITTPSASAGGQTGGDGGTFRTTVHGRAAAISPTWAYSAYPIGGADQAILQDWFEQFVLESPGLDSSTRNSLGLAAPWQP